MATPPTFVGEHEGTAWNTGGGTAKSVTWTPTSGNILVAIAMSEDAGTTLAISGGPTWTLAQSHTTASNCTVYVWTATAASGSITPTITPGGANGNQVFGMNVLEFSGSDGVGASNKAQTTGAPSLGLTTLQDNSAIVVANADYLATDGTSRTWRTVNSVTPTSGNGLEVTYFRNTTNYAVYAAYYSDAGAAGAKTVGLSAPTGQQYSIVAVEVKGAAAGGGATVLPARALVLPSAAAHRAASW